MLSQYFCENFVYKLLTSLYDDRNIYTFFILHVIHFTAGLLVRLERRLLQWILCCQNVIRGVKTPFPLLEASLQRMTELVCVEVFSESNNKRLLLKLDLPCSAEWCRAWKNFENCEVQNFVSIVLSKMVCQTCRGLFMYCSVASDLFCTNIMQCRSECRNIASHTYMYTADYMPKLLPVLGLIRSTDFLH